jgi:hydroxylamine dehydrogenase
MTWSFRTVWATDKLGDWQDRRARMEAICASCHAPEFYKTYFLTADLVNLQYNEIRRTFVYWTKKLTASGKIKRLWENGVYYSDPVLNGWDEDPEYLAYHAWHHEGRRFRHGAEMMGADFTQWHGIWEVQHDLIEVIKWAAEHGDSEAKVIAESVSPSKFITYALYDIPGTPWSINARANTTPYVYNTFPDYWDRVFANVKTAYEKKLLSQSQWDHWNKRFEKKDHYLGLKYTADTDSTWNLYKKRHEYDLEQMNKQVVDYQLPGKPFFRK